MSQFHHFKQLDGWRGLSIILVLAGHLAGSSGLVPPPFNNPSLAVLGVTCFFVLSGFLITGLLCDEKASTGTISLSQFYIRRVLRIVPAYYLFLFAIFILSNVHLITDVPTHEFAICLLYLRDFAGRSTTLKHTWSLSLEEQFYIIWPMLVQRWNKDRAILAAFSVCIIVPIWRAIATIYDICPVYRWFRPDFKLDCLLIGCLIALLYFHKRDTLLKISRFGPNNLVACLLLLLWTLFGWQNRFVAPIHLSVQIWLIAFLLVRCVMLEETALNKLLSQAWLRWVGRISYSLYLWQQPFLETSTPSWGIVRVPPINIIATFLLASISHYAVEAPFLKLKSKFKQRIVIVPANIP
jgi:peptidoglycan/LPS O-acetylase OafA/YrhL